MSKMRTNSKKITSYQKALSLIVGGCFLFSVAHTDEDAVFQSQVVALHQSIECENSPKEFTVNFEEISIIELIQFISRISNINFIFEKSDLQFPVTIISEDPTSVEDLMGALMQILKTRGLSVVEQGNNVLIYRNELLSKVSKVITDSNITEACDSAIITRVYRLNMLAGNKIAPILRPLLSKDAIVEVSEETRHLIVTDITTNIEKITELLIAIDQPQSELEVTKYKVKGAYPEALVAYAKEILAPLIKDQTFQLVVQPGSGQIFIVAPNHLVEKTLEILTSLDDEDISYSLELPASHMANSNFRMYKLKFHDGSIIADAIRTIGNNMLNYSQSNSDLISTIQSIEWLEVNNSLVISGTDESIAKVVQLIDELDEMPKQVYIEVLIIDTTLENSLDFGVQWIALGDEQNKLAFGSGLLSTAPPASNLQAAARVVASPPDAPQIPNPGLNVPLPSPPNLQGFSDLVNSTSAFGLGIVGNIIRHNGQSFLTLGALVSALEEEAVTKIVLNPRIMTEDTQEANFFVGQNIPYQTTSTVIQQTGSVTQNLQYEDVGVQLRVTPTIAPNNVVTLEIDQSIAELVTGIGVLTPTTNKTLATTRVHVPNGSFLVMSGHIRDQQTCIQSGIPCLGTLPLIGPTFSRTVNGRSKRNLIMFLRPRVVSTIQEGLDLTNQEGYDYNWESDPCSLIECGPKVAPECEQDPPLPCPIN